MVENFVKAARPADKQTVIIETVTEKIETGVKVTTNIYCGGWKNRAEAYNAFKNEGFRQKKTKTTSYVYGLMKLSHVKEDEAHNYFIRNESTGEVLNASE